MSSISSGEKGFDNCEPKKPHHCWGHRRRAPHLHRPLLGDGREAPHGRAEVIFSEIFLLDKPLALTGGRFLLLSVPENLRLRRTDGIDFRVDLRRGEEALPSRLLPQSLEGPRGLRPANRTERLLKAPVLDADHEGDRTPVLRDDHFFARGQFI